MLAFVPSWVWSGERGMLRAFEGELTRANETARALRDQITDRHFAEVEDVVPGARTLLVVLRPGAEPSEDLRASLEAEPRPRARRDASSHEIQVRYDGEDLQALAQLHGISPDEVARLHASADYTVAFIGFAPGFPYLLGLPERLATPRLSTPRTKVPAGSVAIGGQFAGIYPRATPGGWWIIGSADVTLFDAAQTPPVLLAPGDHVRFLPG